ncbi:hypothetical protein RIF29_22293 [Crotalaria pallida]|uniref:Pectinesterase n=1 Tax=Crotalaria pallida TaxID=3830 RepID=A0AAN9IEB3_CROPI
MLKGKILVSGVSLILVVGVVIGVVVVVKNNNGTQDPQVQAHQKQVKTICQNTEDPKLCHDTLNKASPSNGTDPKAYIAVAVQSITDSVIKAVNMSDRLYVEHGKDDSKQGMKMALEDCKDLMEFSMDSIEASVNMVQNNNIQAVHDQTPDFRNWLSAIISYQQACMDGFEDGKDGEEKVKEQLNTQSLDIMGRLTGIALDIVTDMSKILQQFDLKLDLKPASRRLLAEEVDDEGYPTWFSATDRHLLAKGDKGQGPKPNVVVAQDGSGQFKTIKEAIDSYPKNFKGRYIIYVKAGVYDEYITVPKKSINILMYGDGPTKTIVTGRKCFRDGVKTMQTATFANTANGFIGKSMAFENTAGAAGHQAVALRNQGDMSAFFDCAMHGYQDTLYVQTNRQFYRNCEISGTIDFIFGSSSTLIQNSRIIVRKPGPSQFNTVTADGTKQRNMATGIVLQNCEILPEKELYPVRFDFKSYLGRPWKDYARTVVMESTIGDFIQPEGWTPWSGTLFLDTLYYAEYANTGPGANLNGRVKWKGYHPNIPRDEAATFTAGMFLRGGESGRAEDWLDATGIPYVAGFTK